MTRRLRDTTPKADYRTSISFDEQTWHAIHDLAEESFMTVSAMARHLVRQHAMKQKEQGLSA